MPQAAVTLHVHPRSGQDVRHEEGGAMVGGTRVRCHNVVNGGNKDEVFEKSVRPVVERVLKGENGTVLTMGDAWPPAEQENRLEGMIGSIPLSERERPLDGIAVRALRYITNHVGNRYKLKVAFPGLHSSTDPGTLKNFNLFHDVRDAASPSWGDTAVLGGTYVSLSSIEAFVGNVNRIFSSETAMKRLKEKNCTLVMSVGIQHNLDPAKPVSYLYIADVLKDHNTHFKNLIRTWLSSSPDSGKAIAKVLPKDSNLGLIVPCAGAPPTADMQDLLDRVWNSSPDGALQGMQGSYSELGVMDTTSYLGLSTTITPDTDQHKLFQLCNDQRTKIREIEATLRSLENERIELVQQKDDAVQERSMCQGQLTELNAKKDDIEVKSKELEALKTTLQEELTALKKTRYTLDVELNETKSNLAKTREDLEETKTKSQKRKEEDSATIHSLEAELRVTETDLKDKLRNAERTKDSAVKKQEEAERAEAILHRKLEEMHLKHNTEATSTEEKEKILETRLREVTNKTEELRREMSKKTTELQGKVEAAEDKLASEKSARKKDNEEAERSLQHKDDLYNRKLDAAEDRLKRAKDASDEELKQLQLQHERDLKRKEIDWERQRQQEQDDSDRKCREKVNELEQKLNSERSELQALTDAADRQKQKLQKELEASLAGGLSDKQRWTELEAKLAEQKEQLENERDTKRRVEQDGISATSEHTRKLRSIENERDTARRDLDAAKQRLRNLEDELAEGKVQSTEALQNADERERAALSQLESTLHQLNGAQGECRRLTMMNTDLERRITTLKKQEEGLILERDSLQSELREAERGGAGKTRDVNNLEAEIKRLKGTVQDSAEERRKLDDEMDTQRRAVGDWERKHNELQEQLTRHKAEKTRLENDLRSQIEKQHRLEGVSNKDRAQMEEENRGLKASLEKAEERERQAELSRVESMKPLSSLSTELAQTKKRLGECELDRDKLRSKMDDAAMGAASKEVELAGALSRVRELEQVLSGEQRAVSETRDAAARDAEDAQRDRKKFEHELSLLNEEIENKTRLANKLRKDASDAAGDLNKCEAESDNLKQRLDDALKQLSAAGTRTESDERKLRESMNEANRCADEAALALRTVDKLQRQNDNAKEEIIQLKENLEAAKRDGKSAAEAAEDRGRQLSTTADDIRKAAESRQRDLEVEMEKARTSYEALQKKMTQELGDSESRLTTLASELAESSRVNERLRTDLLKSTSEVEQWRARAGEHQRALEAAHEAKRVTELETTNAVAASERQLERAKLADSRAAAAEERAMRFSHDAETARKEIDDIRAQAQNKIDDAHQKELDATEAQNKERRSRLAVESKAKALDDETTKLQRLVSDLEQDAARMQDEARSAVAKERELERKLWSLQTESDEQRNTFDRQLTLAKDEATRVSNRLAAEVVSKREANESLVAEAAERSKMKVDLENAQTLLAAAQQESDRHKSQVAELQSRLSELRKELDNAVAAHGDAMNQKETEMMGVSEELRKEKSAKRILQDQVLSLEEQNYQVQEEKSDLYDQVSALQQDCRSAEARIRDKERELERSKHGAEGVRKGLEDELDSVRAAVKEHIEKGDKMQNEVMALRKNDGRQGELRDADRRLREAEDEARRAKETARIANRQLDDVSKRADSNAERVAKLQREIDSLQSQLTESADVADTIITAPSKALDIPATGRLGNSLAAIARRSCDSRGEVDRLKRETAKYMSLLEEERSKLEGLESINSRLVLEQQSTERKHTDEKKHLSAAKVILEHELADLRQQLENEQKSNEEGASAALKHAEKLEAAARAAEAKLRAELSDSNDSLAAADVKSKQKDNEMHAIETQVFKLRKQIEEEEERSSKALVLQQREASSERDRLQRQCEAVQDRNEGLLRSNDDAKRQISELKANLEQYEKQQHRAHRTTERSDAITEALKADIAKLKNQLAASETDNELASKREAEAAQKISDLDKQLADTLHSMRDAEVRAETRSRATHKLEALLNFADHELGNLASHGRLMGAATSPPRFIRRNEKDQALLGIARGLRRTVELTSDPNPADLSKKLDGITEMTGQDVRTHLAEWYNLAHIVKDAYPDAAGYISRAQKAVVGLLENSDKDGEDISQEVRPIAGPLSNNITTLSLGDRGEGSVRFHENMVDLENAVSELAGRPSCVPDNFKTAIMHAMNFHDPALSSVLTMMQQRAEGGSSPYSEGEGDLAAFVCELVVALTTASSISDLLVLSDTCGLLAEDLPQARSDLARLRSTITRATDAALLCDTNTSPAISEALSLFSKIATNYFAPRDIAQPYSWDKNGKRRLQSGFDALESKLADSERENSRLKKELDTCAAETGKYRSMLATAEEQLADAERLASSRLRGHQVTTGDMNIEITRLADKLAVANNELQDARTAQQRAETARWDVEGKLRSSQNEIKMLSQTVDRLQVEAETVRSKLREVDDEKRDFEEKLIEKEAAAQRKADSSIREAQSLKEKCRNLEADHNALAYRLQRQEAERNEALRRAEATEAKLRNCETDYMDALSRTDDAERQQDFVVSDLQKARTEASESKTRLKLLEAELHDAKRRAELAETQQWTCEAERDEAKRRSEAVERTCRQLELQHEKVMRLLQSAEDRAADAERLSSERLHDQNAANELSMEVRRLAERLAAAQSEAHQARENSRELEKDKWELEGLMHTHENDKQSLLRQLNKLQQDFESQQAKARGLEDLAERARKADVERSDALRRADASLRDVEETRNRQRITEAERAEMSDRLLTAETELAESQRRHDSLKYKLKSVDSELADVKRRAVDAEERADDLEERLLQEETESRTRLHRAEAELEELRKNLGSGGSKEQLAATQQTLVLLQDTESDLRDQVRQLEMELAHTSRVAAGAEDLRSRMVEVSKRLDDSEEAIELAENARKHVENELAAARDNALVAEHRARDAARRVELLEREIEEGRNRLKICDSEKGDLHERVLNAENLREEARRKLGLSQHQVKSLQAELEDFKRLLKIAEEEADDSQTVAARDKAELERAEGELEELRTAVIDMTGMRQQLGDLQRRLALSEDSEEELKLANQKNEAALSDLRRSLSQAEDVKGKLSDMMLKTTDLEEKLQHMHEENLRLEMELAGCKDQLKDQEQKLRMAQREADVSNREATDATEKLRSLETENSDFQQRVLALEKGREESRRRCETAEKKLVSTEQLAEDSRRRARGAEKITDEMSAEMQDLKRILQGSQGEATELRKSTFELTNTKQQLADITRKLSNIEGVEAELRGQVSRLENRLKQTEDELLVAHGEAAASNELKLKLNEAKRRQEQSEGQISGLENVRVQTEEHLLTSKQQIKEYEMQLQETDKKLEATLNELNEAKTRCRGYEAECGSIQGTLMRTEAECDELRRKQEQSEMNVDMLEKALQEQHRRVEVIEKRTDASDEKAAAALQQMMAASAKHQETEAQLHEAQTAVGEVRDLKLQVADMQNRLIEAEEVEAARRKENAKLRVDLNAALRESAALPSLEEELSKASRLIAQYEARAGRDQEIRKKCQEDTLAATEASRGNETQVKQLEDEVSTLQAIVARLEGENRDLASTLTNEAHEAERSGMMASMHEANAAELATGLQELQMKLEQSQQVQQLQLMQANDENKNSLLNTVTILEADLNKARASASHWEAQARALNDELEGTDVTVGTIAANMPAVLNGTLVVTAPVMTARERFAKAVLAVDPANAHEMGKLRSNIRDTAATVNADAERKVCIHNNNIKYRQALETCGERLGSLHRRMARGDQPDPGMIAAIGEALGLSDIVSKQGGKEKEMYDLLEGAVDGMQRGILPNWIVIEDALRAAGMHGAASCIRGAAKHHKRDPSMITAVASAIKEHGWELYSALEALASKQPSGLDTDDPILSRAHHDSESASLAAEYGEVLLALDPASSVMMDVLKASKRNGIGWDAPRLLKEAFDRAAAQAVEASTRSALRTASQRVQRGEYLHPALFALSQGSTTPEVVALLRNCKDDLPSGAADIAKSLGRRLSHLEEPWAASASSFILEAALLTPPHAPHNIIRALRMLSSNKVVPMEVIQQLRDDARSSASVLYDVPILQNCLRKTGERLASVQRDKTAEKWQLQAIAAALCAGVHSISSKSVYASNLVKNLTDAEKLRTIPRLTLVELCEIPITDDIAHQKALQRLTALRRRAEGGALVEAWEIKVVRECLEGALAQPEEESLITTEGSPERNGLRAARKTVRLRDDHTRILEYVVTAMEEVAAKKRLIAELTEDVERLRGDVVMAGDDVVRDTAVLHAKLKETERSLSVTRGEVDAARQRENTYREEVESLRRMHMQSVSPEAVIPRRETNALEQEINDLTGLIMLAWRGLSPPGCDSASGPGGIPDLMEMNTLINNVKKEAETHGAMTRKLKSLVSKYAPVLEAPPSPTHYEKDIVTLETVLAVLNTILEKLVQDVEGAQMVITRQNEHLRTARLSVSASAFEIADLSHDISPQRSSLRTPSLRQSSISTAYPSAYTKRY